jgi:hypothetical protein
MTFFLIFFEIMILYISLLSRSSPHGYFASIYKGNRRIRRVASEREGERRRREGCQRQPHEAFYKQRITINPIIK